MTRNVYISGELKLRQLLMHNVIVRTPSVSGNKKASQTRYK